jgi:hypothetical protein
VRTPAGSAPEGFPGDLAHPEPLTAARAKDASDLGGVLEEYLIRCLFSANWQLREAGLHFLAARLAGQVGRQLPSLMPQNPHFLLCVFLLPAVHIWSA